MPAFAPRLDRRTLATAVVSALVLAALPSTAGVRQGPERVRVPTSYANVHMGPNTTTEVLVLVPRDAVLTVLARDKEWIQVQLTPDLRTRGMVMRWYKNEDRGWMHDSTVAVQK